MLDTTEAVAELEALYDDLTAIVGPLSEEEFSKKRMEERWGIREILAYHTYWLGKLAGAMEHINRGKDPSDQELNWDTRADTIDIVIEHVRGKIREDVLFEFEQAIARFTDVITGYAGESNRYDGQLKTLLNRGLDGLREDLEIVHGWLGTPGAGGSEPGLDAQFNGRDG